LITTDDQTTFLVIEGPTYREFREAMLYVAKRQLGIEVSDG
jgi:hypothetical protein